MIRLDNVDSGRERQRNGMNRTSSASVRLIYELGERLQLQLGDGKLGGHRGLSEDVAGERKFSVRSRLEKGVYPTSA